MDLNRTGSIRLNTEVAFEVQATDAHGRPKLDLDLGQYWRGAALNFYDHGRWFNRGIWIFQPPDKVDPEHAPELPQFDQDPYHLKFTLSNRSSSRRFLLAEPVTVKPSDSRLPVLVLGRRSHQRPPAHHLDMEVMWPAVSREEVRWTYLQAMLPPDEPGLSRPVKVTRLDRTPLAQAPDVPGLREWTDNLLQHLVTEGRLAAADLRRHPDGTLVEANHEESGPRPRSRISSAPANTAIRWPVRGAIHGPIPCWTLCAMSKRATANASPAPSP